MLLINSLKDLHFDSFFPPLMSEVVSVSAEICNEVGLPFFHFMQLSDRVCNPCGRKIRNLGQSYQFIKPAITSTASTPVKTSKHTVDTSDKASPAGRKSKSVRVNSRAAKSPSIEGSTSATD